MNGSSSEGGFCQTLEKCWKNKICSNNSSSYSQSMSINIYRYVEGTAQQIDRRHSYITDMKLCKCFYYVDMYKYLKSI